MPSRTRPLQTRGGRRALRVAAEPVLLEVVTELVVAHAEPTGGLFASPEGAPGTCHNIYFQVTDIDATLNNVRAAGGQVLVPKTKIANVGYFAIFSDPDGIAIGVMKPEH